jgi:hypothetical protein
VQPALQVLVVQLARLVLQVQQALLALLAQRVQPAHLVSSV